MLDKKEMYERAARIGEWLIANQLREEAIAKRDERLKSLKKDLRKL